MSTEKVVFVSVRGEIIMGIDEYGQVWLRQGDNTVIVPVDKVMAVCRSLEDIIDY